MVNRNILWFGCFRNTQNKLAVFLLNENSIDRISQDLILDIEAKSNLEFCIIARIIVNNSLMKTSVIWHDKMCYFQRKSAYLPG